MDITFKYDEECEMYDPYLKEKIKTIASKNHNVMNILTTSSHGIWQTKVTAGSTFLVSVSVNLAFFDIFFGNFCIFTHPLFFALFQKTNLKGLENMPMTYIFTRECY